MGRSTRGPARLQISRVSRHGKTVYLHRGRPLNDPEQLERIGKLAIPPAWKDVEISASATGKVQARGTDEAGRRQAIYHPGFRRRRDRQKFARLPQFGAGLPELRAQLHTDLHRDGLTEATVIAAVIKLLDLHWLRLGSPRYTKRYKSFGAITLRRRHATFSGQQLVLGFTGKSGQRQQVQVNDPLLVRVVRDLDQQPGYQIFRIRQESGKYRAVRGEQVNGYLQQVLGQGFSAKDFRTWGGSLTALAALLDGELSTGASRPARQEAQRAAAGQAARVLGNTVATARNAYIAPAVLELAMDPAALESLRSWRSTQRDRKYQGVDEQCLIRVLDGT